MILDTKVRVLMYKRVNKIFSIDNFHSTFSRKFSPEFTFDGEMHNFWEAVFVEQGTVEINRDENIFILEAGDLVFHAPMEFHSIRSTKKSSPLVKNLSFTSVGNIPRELKSGIFKVNKEEKKDFLKLFRKASEFLKNEESTALEGQEAALLLEAFIIHICNNHNVIFEPSNSVNALTFRRLAETMNENIYNNISISEIAEKNYVSVSYVKALFRRYAGTSPKNYYTNLRIYEASKLLEKDESVKSISERMKFSSPNYFSSFFKKYTGLTPVQYKKKIIK